MTVGECAGFVVPALAGALSAGWPAPAAAAVLLPAGAVEGAALGWAQARVLRRVVPAFPVRRFTVATAGAASFAYLIGMTPAVVGERLGGLPPGLLVGLGVVLGPVLLASIGAAQWLVMRRVLAGSASWVATTAGAWAAGLLVFVAVTTPLWHPGQPLPAVIGIGVLGGAAMALAVAALTGAAVIRLLRRAECRPGR